jgi:starvation-inducible outer membrane lipoprotein
MKKMLLFFALVLLLSGCSAIPMITGGARIAVSGYCAIHPLGRAVVRSDVKLALAPNRIEIICADD